MPSLSNLPLALVLLALALHVLGERRAAIKTGRPRSVVARRRTFCFYVGLASTLIALVGPIDALAPKLFWVHMTQHVLLLTLAAPLIVLGAPWMATWRPLPLGFRRSVARAIAFSPTLAPLRALGRLLGRPGPAWLAFSANLVFWHLPFAYDLTLRSTGIHVLEHITFVLFSILLWAQVLESPPLRRRLSAIHRVYYIIGATVVGWVISLVLAFASHPLYSGYAQLAHRPGGISALADQQLAAGIMLGPGSLAATLYVFVALYRWLGKTEEQGVTASEPPHERQYA
ncbi:MAG: cytochrome c oxidase assembly protein [Actinomycetota bacterium]|nr:cytochrome c oxidase assembly protein [Actinomycetota bacterium]